MKHCCIIGGSGFIGSHLIKPLLSTNRKITIIGRNAIPTRHLPKDVSYLAGDYGDCYFIRGVLQEVDEIIALAHSTVPKTSFENPIKDITSNLPAAVQLFDIASDLSIKKLVFVSSGGTVYGKPLKIPLTEEHPTNPISPYGITKITIEKYAKMFYELRALPIVCVRPSNAFGEGQQPFTGQGFIATAIASVFNGEELLIFGEKGTVRDYIHVSDVASGIISALEQGKPGSSYNIGSGVGRNNKEILDIVFSLAKQKNLQTKVKILPPRDFDVPINILDCKKIKADTGWLPKISFEEGIRSCWEWFCKNSTLCSKQGNK